MTRLKLIACGIALALFLQSCKEILEPVSFFSSKPDVKIENVQEDFEINIKSLTFESAREANKAPYPRRLMQTGIGSSANVFDEADFLTSNMPLPSKSTEYLLGIGDQLSFARLNEFVPFTTQFPTDNLVGDYLLGVGDELTLVQLNEIKSGFSNIISSIANSGDNKKNESGGTPQLHESILKNSGIIGTNGNILLLGLGSIKAENRTLSDIQTEVRNILIRNGLAPNFQLEITGFNSKKAYVTFPNPAREFGKNIISITNLPITLKELAINYGARPSLENTSTITLTRKGQKFKTTSGKLFEDSFPRIVIQTDDQIEIEEIEDTTRDPKNIVAVVGSQGDILLPGLGSFKAANRSLAEVQADISRILQEKGFVPSFQLEVTNFKSRNFFLITNKSDAKDIPLKTSKLTLREAILGNLNNSTNSDSLTVVELKRNDLSYRMTLQEILGGGASKIFVQDGDIIKLKDLKYKLGEVFALGGAGNAQIVPIDPSKRETLADILFTSNGALTNLKAKRSEVYLLRGRSPSDAYHLDAQNVSRILVAAQTELRPNDIVYVADRPIISFARTLVEINPLRILLRDIQEGNIP
jgi:protein involved in polysaccharide export with SLBB domain